MRVYLLVLKYIIFGNHTNPVWVILGSKKQQLIKTGLMAFKCLRINQLFMNISGEFQE